jgi:catechol 2,3-dioxygenase-like lactoylglutathione lyase family enzyme
MFSDYPVFPVLLSTDMEASRTFYGQTLGLELVSEYRIGDVVDRLVYKCGNGTQVAISNSTIGTSDTQTQCVFRVPDLRAAIDDLRARGVKVEEYDEPKTDDGIADMGHSWAAWIVDPCRNVLGVVQPKG